MPKLKPCQHCGSAPMYYIGAFSARYIIRCPACKYTVWSNVSFDEAVRKWHRRAGDGK